MTTALRAFARLDTNMSENEHVDKFEDVVVRLKMSFNFD